MEINKKFKNLLFKTLLVCIGWFIVALLISTMTFLNQLQGNYSLALSTLNVILFEVVCITPWIISTPFIIWATRKYRFDKVVIHKSCSIHLLIIIVVFSFHSVVQSYAVALFYEHTFSWSYMQSDLVRFLDMRLLFYFGVVLGIYAIDFYHKTRESKLRAPRLRAQLNEAKYQALLNQIQPTFLLNSIDTIHSKVKSSPSKSKEILVRFSDLLRRMLQNADREEVTIDEDLESFHLYLNLLEKRFETKIEKRVSVSRECEDAQVPAYLVYLMLVLLIEEIVTADPQNITEIKRICYSAKRAHNILHLRISIEDLELASADLADYLRRARFDETKQCLQRKYGNNVDLQIQVVGNTVQAHFQIPYRTEEVDGSFFEDSHTEDHSVNQLMQS